MDSNILKLYPQFLQSADRRQENKSVDYERRKDERRLSTRFSNPALDKDIASIKNTFASFAANEDKFEKTLVNHKAAIAALSPIVPLRRISSVPDNIENGDYERAAGLVAVAGIMLPEDLRDMKDAWNQVVYNKLPNYDYKNCQAPFRFIRGTLAEAPVNRMGKYGYYAHEFDKSFAETKLGEKIRKLLNVNFGKPEITERNVPRVIKEGNEYLNITAKIKAEKLEGIFLNKILYRAMQRTTVIGAIILSALWVPSIIKAFNKPYNTHEKFANAGKQSLKASINVVSVLSGIGIIGALGAKKGPAGSVIGMGIGSVIGSFIANKINNNIKTL